MTHFHRWIMFHCGETTKDKMDELLCAESDWATLQVLTNSLNMEQGEREQMIKKFSNSLGHLYPGYMTELRAAKEFRTLKEVVGKSCYGPAFELVRDPGEMDDGSNVNQPNDTIDDIQKKDLS